MPHLPPPNDAPEEEPNDTQDQAPPTDQPEPEISQDAQPLADDFRGQGHGHDLFKVEEVTEETPSQPQPRQDTSYTEVDSDPSQYQPQESYAPSPHHLEHFAEEDNPAPPDPDFRPNPPTSRDYFQFPREPRRPLPIPIPLIATVVIGLIVFLLIAKFTLFKGSSEDSSTPTDILIESTSGSPAPTPSGEPGTGDENSPSPTTDRADIKVQVLNGSGVVGAAGKLAKVLKDAGFEDVDTANAENYSATGVTIRVKEDKKSTGDMIKKDLTGDYEDITVKETLDDSSDYDAVVTLGKQSGDASPSPSASPAVQGAATSSADLKKPSDK